MDESDLVGNLIDGRYRLESKLGAGGMGTAYLTVDEQLHGRKVVVKIPHPDFLRDRTFRARFRNEIRSLIEVEHSSIVSVLDGGESDGTPYLVLKFLRGGSLHDRIKARGGKLSLDQILKWLPPVSAALDFIHARGVLHRDVKPANVLFDQQDHPYLADFGIAKVLTESDATITMTETGALVGSPAYMAPEAAIGSTIGAAYDQYGLAVMVYQALCGKLPHEGSGFPAAWLAQKISTPPDDLAIHAPHLPRGVITAVMKALSPSPVDRFPSCAEFASALSAELFPSQDPFILNPATLVPADQRLNLDPRSPPPLQGPLLPRPPGSPSPEFRKTPRKAVRPSAPPVARSLHTGERLRSPKLVSDSNHTSSPVPFTPHVSTATSPVHTLEHKAITFLSYLPGMPPQRAGVWLNRLVQQASPSDLARRFGFGVLGGCLYFLVFIAAQIAYYDELAATFMLRLLVLDMEPYIGLAVAGSMALLITRRRTGALPCVTLGFVAAFVMFHLYSGLV